MSATPATVYGVNSTKLVGNVGGAIQSLPEGYFVNGKERYFAESLVLNSQASGVVIMVARIPLPFVFLGLLLCTDTSLGSSTIAFGNAGNGNSAIYAAAATFTATDTPTGKGKALLFGTAIASGFDSQGNATSTTASYGFGGAYEDVIMTVGAATMPSSGNLRIVFKYGIE